SNFNSYIKDVSQVVVAVAFVALCPELMIRRGTVANEATPLDTTSSSQQVVTLDHFRAALEAHPEATRFVLKKEAGQISIQPQEAIPGAAGRNRSDNMDITRALRVALEQYHAPKIVDGLFPESKQISFICPAVSAEKLRAVFSSAVTQSSSSFSRKLLAVNTTETKKTVPAINNSANPDPLMKPTIIINKIKPEQTKSPLTNIDTFKVQLAKIEARIAQVDFEAKDTAFKNAEAKVERLLQSDANRTFQAEREKQQAEELNKREAQEFEKNEEVEIQQHIANQVNYDAMRALANNAPAAQGVVNQAIAETLRAYAVGSFERRKKEVERGDRFKKSQEDAALKNEKERAVFETSIDEAKRALDVAQQAWEQSKKIADEAAKSVITAEEDAAKIAEEELMMPIDDEVKNGNIFLNKKEVIKAIVKAHQIANTPNDQETAQIFQIVVATAEKADALAQKIAREAKVEAAVAEKRAHESLESLQKLQERLDANADEIAAAHALAKKAVADAEAARKTAKEATAAAKAAEPETTKAFTNIRELDDRVTDLETAIKIAVDAKKSADEAKKAFDERSASNEKFLEKHLASMNAMLKEALDAKQAAENNVIALEAALKATIEKAAADAKILEERLVAAEKRGTIVTPSAFRPPPPPAREAYINKATVPNESEQVSRKTVSDIPPKQDLFTTLFDKSLADFNKKPATLVTTSTLKLKKVGNNSLFGDDNPPKKDTKPAALVTTSTLKLKKVTNNRLFGDDNPPKKDPFVVSDDNVNLEEKNDFINKISKFSNPQSKPIQPKNSYISTYSKPSNLTNKAADLIKEKNNNPIKIPILANNISKSRTIVTSLSEVKRIENGKILALAISLEDIAYREKAQGYKTSLDSWQAMLDSATFLSCQVRFAWSDAIRNIHNYRNFNDASLALGDAIEKAKSHWKRVSIFFPLPDKNEVPWAEKSWQEALFTNYATTAKWYLAYYEIAPLLMMAKKESEIAHINKMRVPQLSCGYNLQDLMNKNSLRAISSFEFATKAWSILIEKATTLRNTLPEIKNMQWDQLLDDFKYQEAYCIVSCSIEEAKKTAIIADHARNKAVTAKDYNAKQAYGEAVLKAREAENAWSKAVLVFNNTWDSLPNYKKESLCDNPPWEFLNAESQRNYWSLQPGALDVQQKTQQINGRWMVFPRDW
ncbi:MAG: hypothetical protein ACH346_05870, partial [Chthoniobacterales bacterium]